MKPTLVWVRNDLRLHDNPALRWACDRKRPVVLLYVWSPDADGAAAPGAASRVWLDASLRRFADSVSQCGGTLTIRMGDPRDVIPKVANETDADAVCWNRRCEPSLTAIDAEIKSALKEKGMDVRSFPANVLYEPWSVDTKDGNAYKVFTPYWNACRKIGSPHNPVPTVQTIHAPGSPSKSETIDSLGLRPTIDWDTGIRAAWEPGETAALKRMKGFLKGAVSGYAKQRDFPAEDAVSRLSPYLHFGELSVRTIWSESRKTLGDADHTDPYLRQTGWRDFAHHVLYRFPHTIERALQPKFEDFPWRDDPDGLRAWQRGRTGYPIVDAGMRELWETGWMHNRVRMIVGSFLVKDLLIDWRVGTAWFWDTLVDADLANNTLGWQWIGGCGADAAPYFRIFNPVTQSRRFDPEGAYLRRWVPELADLPNKLVHAPWEAPPDVLEDSGVRLGETYPAPIVDHAEARDRALKVFKKL